MAKLKYDLILEIGGLRGNSIAGMPDTFLKKEIGFPYIIDVSAGAVMVCSLVLKTKRTRIFVS
jgi:predicted patatin/cPLA2 family phospholipase